MILLISCYELGHQPLSLAWPLAFLRRHGLAAETLDLAIQPFDADLALRADFVGIAVPMHTALRIGVPAAKRIRAVNPRAHICFFGLYAYLNEDYLLKEIADSVIGGEYEEQLVELIASLQLGNRSQSAPAGLPARPLNLSTASHRAPPTLSRLSYPIPHRSALPPLAHYAHYSNSNFSLSLSGYVESTRGCLHTCRHCPIVPVYNGRFFAIPLPTVLADIRQQIEMGARHITFGDPDFLNGPTHALRLARALRKEFSYITFDFTAKVEHILKHRALFPEFAALGCVFVTSAIESLSDLVLEKLAKNHTAADIDEALAILDSSGIALHPTLVAFTPWTTLDDYLNQLGWIHERGLAGHIPPVQLSIRLLIPPRSALLSLPDTPRWLGPLDSARFTYHWSHPDPRMDNLQSLVSNLVEAAERAGESPLLTNSNVRALAHSLARRPLPLLSPLHPPRLAPPRLTENWFC